MTGIVDNLIQCWSCQIFDRLFQIASMSAAAIYNQMVIWAWLVLVGFWAFYALWVVYLNFKDKESKDWLYQKSVKPVLINSLLISVLLGMGVVFPKMVASVIFEPVASMTSIYAEAVLQTDANIVAQRITYRPEPMANDGFFRPELRDKIIHLMRVSVTQFQTMIKLGGAVMENSFSLRALFSDGPLPLNIVMNLLKQMLMFVLGAYLVYNFFRLFMRFCFYFIDVIVALIMFAFFFPFMLVFFVFKNSSAADWVKKYGDAFSPALIKDVLNAIALLVMAVITYTIAMVVIAKFFASDMMSSNEIVSHILAGTVSRGTLSNDNLTNLTLMSCIVIGFVLNYLTAKIPDVSKEVFSAFGLEPEKAALGKDVGERVEKIVQNTIEGVVSKGKVLVGKAVENKEEKKEEKKEETKTN